MSLITSNSDFAAEAAGPIDLPNARRRTRVQELQTQLARLGERMRIAVIHGGNTNANGAVIHRTFNPRSWKSYEKVAVDISDALRRLGFRHVITMPDDMKLGNRLRREAIDFAWLNTAGVQGIASVSHASSMLEMFGIPYVGHNPLNAATLDNKHVFKRDLILAGIPTAPFLVCQPWRAPLNPEVDEQFLRVFSGFSGPFVIKPVSGRASHYVNVVNDIKNLSEMVEDIFSETNNAVLIEKFLPGREYCISICGEVISKNFQIERRMRPFTFSAVERVLERDENIFTSMDLKPITVDRVQYLDPLADKEIIEKLKEIGENIYTSFDIETLIRLDVRADQNGHLHVLEANPKPDLAAPDQIKTNLVCSGLKNEGMNYDDLIFSLIADRIDILFSRRRATVNHLVELIS